MYIKHYLKILQNIKIPVCNFFYIEKFYHHDLKIHVKCQIKKFLIDKYLHFIGFLSLLTFYWKHWLIDKR